MLDVENNPINIFVLSWAEKAGKSCSYAEQSPCIRNPVRVQVDMLSELGLRPLISPDSGFFFAYSVQDG